MSITSKLAALMLLGAAALSAAAQPAAWPTRPVRLIVSFAPGGSADGLARFVGQKLAERWGQPVNVDNKPGGNTIISAMEAVRAAPDGYTLYQSVNSTLTMNPFAASKLPYDPQRDFTPISQVTTVPMIWAANDRLPAKTMQEFVTYARAHPNEVTVGIASVVAQAAVEKFTRDWGMQVRLIPYKSGVDITKALLSGDIQVGFDGAAVYPAHIKAGKLRGLATTGPRRLDMFGGKVPTIVEQGLNKTEVPVWFAVMAPAGLPDAIRNKIAADLREVMALPDVRARMSDIGMESAWSGPDDLLKLIRSESAVLGPLVRELGIRIE
ncbi:tripartite tricarboxylate transporter substrate binding protein [Variovorax guangxiensis]|uniref:Bug family tripartite tricarboxylate transporter substrate binding protein n=1 Tax=Variovorax guangxiensis TaxID=1775474 RepID=UPI0028625122|nr:tripartite tricarboxylate transporter substrate binding protein [Variovorax guangxiensis]MDR6858778.1 tripartite-type tricarboxylate transporter receptor subunit TctC [Variovorax guangxiensis]